MRVLTLHGPGDLRLDEAPLPTPGGNDVVVRVRACGVCGSDLGFLKYGQVRGPESGPMAIGHEASGEIVAVGADVAGLHLGQRVVVNPMATSGLIGNGGPEGAFADALLVRGARLGDNLHVIPDDLPWDVAALTEPLAVSLHGVNRGAAKPGEKVVVYGCGPIGLGVVLWLADRGVDDVVAIDLSEDRLARARAFGARATINAGREDVRARLAEMHGTERLFSRTVVGSDLFIDAAGSHTILGDVVGMAKRHARLVVMAAYHESVPLPLGILLSNEMTITAALAYPDEMPAVVAALPRLRGKLAAMISHRVPFVRVTDAFAIAATPQSAKVMVAFDD